MKPTHSVLAFALLIALSGRSALAAGDVDLDGVLKARDFLEAYRIADAGEAPLFELYSDQAMVHVRIEGQPQGFVLAGRAYKAWNRELFRQGQLRTETSVFHLATVERRGARLTIRARRYSASFCYWDDDYRVTIEQQGLRGQIIDERLTLQPKSKCPIAAPRIAATSLAPANVLPGSISNPSPATASAPWHPLSHDEISAMALRMAHGAAADSKGATFSAVPPPSPPAALPAPALAGSRVRVDPDSNE